MKSKLLALLLFAIATMAVFVLPRSGRSTSLKANVQQRAPRIVPERLLTPPSDAAVCCSILEDVSLEIEVQSQWTQEQEFMLMVHVKKPVGKAYYINPVEESFILFVNDHPWAVADIRPPNRPAQQPLEANLSKHSPVLYFPPDLPDGAEVVLEWTNYNLRTKTLERLRSATLVVDTSRLSAAQ